MCFSGGLSRVHLSVAAGCLALHLGPCQPPSLRWHAHAASLMQGLCGQPPCDVMRATSLSCPHPFLSYLSVQSSVALLDSFPFSWGRGNLEGFDMSSIRNWIPWGSHLRLLVAIDLYMLLLIGKKAGLNLDCVHDDLLLKPAVSAFTILPIPPIKQPG